MDYFAKLKARVASFCDGETGAVTVDWVVLSAAVIGLSIAIYTTLGDGAYEHAEKIGGQFSSSGIMSY